jgi:beta-lactamase superfamily II metal-dependent hydrolase
MSKGLNSYLQEIKNINLDTNASKCKLVESSNILEYSERSFANELYPKTDFINGSSIAFVFELNEKTVLFLGDSHPKPVYAELLKKEIPQNFDCIKLSHHGSLRNLSQDIVTFSKCNKFIISTNGKKHLHPDPETLSKLFIANRNVEKVDKIYFYFNYPFTELDHLSPFCQDAANYVDLALIHPTDGVVEI